MTKALVAVLVLALIACDGKVTTSESARKVRLDKQHCSIPPDYSFNTVTRGIQYQPYRVLVEGAQITWNGADVTSEKRKAVIARVALLMTAVANSPAVHCSELSR